MNGKIELQFTNEFDLMNFAKKLDLSVERINRDINNKEIDGSKIEHNGKVFGELIRENELKDIFIIKTQKKFPYIYRIKDSPFGMYMTVIATDNAEFFGEIYPLSLWEKFSFAEEIEISSDKEKELSRLPRKGIIDLIAEDEK